MTKMSLPPEPKQTGYSGHLGGYYVRFDDGHVEVYNTFAEKTAALERAYQKLNRAVMREAALRNMD